VQDDIAEIRHIFSDYKKLGKAVNMMVQYACPPPSQRMTPVWSLKMEQDRLPQVCPIKAIKIYRRKTNARIY
jgi:hypothetical protein